MEEKRDGGWMLFLLQYQIAQGKNKGASHLLEC